MSKFEEIDVNKVMELLKNNALLIDVRSKESYVKEHIKGAINIPVNEIENRLNEIPKDRPVVVYCTNVNCTASLSAAQKLTSLGYSNVYRFVGGLQEWKSANLPTESG